MMIASYPDFFNDVFGPIMQPGSSSHTAGPCRIGFLARSLLGEELRSIHVLLDADGSFAGTFGVMAEDRGMIAGALGFLPDDERLFDALALADEAGVTYRFEFGELAESRHPNAIKFTLAGASGRAVTLVADSTGGGMIETRVVDGYPLRTKGDAHVLLVFDPEETPEAASGIEPLGALVDLPGVVETGTSQQVQVVGHRKHLPPGFEPSGGLPVSNEPAEASSPALATPGATLHWARLAQPPDLAAIRRALPGFRIAMLDPILPVLDTPGRKPQLFDTMVRWRKIAAERGLSLAETAIQYEMDASGWPRDRVIAYTRMIERAMYRQTHAVYEEALDVPTMPFRPNMAADWARHMASPRRLTDSVTSRTVKWAYGAGAGIPGVPVVAGPMGSGGGYIHAALWAIKEAHGFTDDDLLRGLFVAAGIGAIAYTRTAPTGEVTGCTGETGICGAMAAAAIAEMAGGTPEQVENAASLLLQAVIGMPCDPIAGGAGQPCRSRVLTTTCMAHVFADLALAGRDAILPLHEVIDVADQVGRSLPPGLLCTGRGGMATTPTAQRKAIAFREWFDMTVREGIRRPPGNLI
jgi:L-serine dehydratase